MKILTQPQVPSANAQQSLLPVEQLPLWNPPSTYGFLEWNYDPVIANGGTAPNDTTMYVQRLSTLRALTIANLWVYVTSAGATLTAVRNYMAVYNSAGNLVGQTATTSTLWTGTGYLAAPLSASVSVQGHFYVLLTTSGTTRPSLLKASNQNGNSGPRELSVQLCRWFTNTGSSNASTLTPPSTVTSASRSTIPYWIGVS